MKLGKNVYKASASKESTSETAIFETNFTIPCWNITGMQFELSYKTRRVSGTRKSIGVCKLYPLMASLGPDAIFGLGGNPANTANGALKFESIEWVPN